MAVVQSDSYQGRYLKLTVVEESYSIANNTSTIRWTLESIGGSVNYYSINNCSVVVNGQTVYNSGNTPWNSYRFPAATGSTTGTITVGHNPDGSAPSIGFTLHGRVYYNGDNNRSGSLDLTRIPRYANVYQSIKETGDNYLKINWSADVSCDGLQYSIDGGRTFNDVSGYPVYVIEGLSAGTTYNIVTRARRQDSQLWSNSSVLSITTLSSPYINALSDFNIGTSFSCTIYNPKERNLKLFLYANDVADVIVRTTNVNGTYTYVTTEEEIEKLYESIPKNKNGTYKIAVVCDDLATTRWSNDSVGYKVYYTVESNCKPTISIEARDINEKTLSLTGDSLSVIKYFSKVKAIISSKVYKSASISSQNINCSDGKSMSGSTAVFDNVESGLFTGSIVDSRNYSATENIQLKLIDYIKLTLNIDVYRESPTSGSIVAKFNGNFFNKNFGKVDNILKLKYHYKENGSGVWSEWVELNPVKNGDVYSNGSSPITLGSNFDYQKNWDFEFVATDMIYDDGELSSFKTVVNGTPIFDWGEDDFNINGKLNLYETSIMRHIANILYPVNSIYISLTESIPQLLAGEWEFLNTIVFNGVTYYVYKRVNENEKVYYDNELLLLNNEEIYIENTLLKGSDVL